MHATFEPRAETRNTAAAPCPATGLVSFVATVCAFDGEGLPALEWAAGRAQACERLDTVGSLATGDRVLATWVQGLASPVVVGRLGPPRTHLRLEAGQSLQLACGEASLEMHADGKVLLKGDDVVVRAKGTKRIRAGHVAIN